MPDPVTGIVASSAASAGSNILGSFLGSKKQNAAADRSIAQSMEMFKQLQGMISSAYDRASGTMSPFVEAGGEALRTLMSRMPELTAPIELTQEWLESTPGYQWTRDQGMRAVNLASPLKGLSGSQLKGAAEFATGLADNTYKTQFDIANINKTNAFNRLFQTAESGRGAAKDLAIIGQSGVNALLGAGTSLNKDITGTMLQQGNAQAAPYAVAGQQVGQFVSGLPFAPYTANRLYPNSSPSAPGAKGMYDAVDIMPENI